MHDHLRDLGREMTLELRPPHRLWRPKDIKYLESMGFKSILGKTHVRCFHSFFDESMSYRVTFFLGQPDICVETSASLQWLELQGNSTEQPCIPSWISLQNVQCLKIKRARLKTLWENRIQAPSQLKELQIHETFLEKIPDFSGISDNLENVVLDARGWPIQGLFLLECLRMNLCSLCLRSSTLKGEQASNKTEGRTTCESLVIRNFKLSGEVAWNNRGISSSVGAPMSGLEKLEISGEELVSKILISGIHHPMLESIKLHGMENLREVDLISMKTLNCLDITSCKLVWLNISQSPELEELSLGHLSGVERITIVDCKHLKRVVGTGDLTELGELYINECPELEELPRFSSLCCAEKIEIASCGKLQNIMVSTRLIKLSLQSCRDLQRVEGTGDLTELEELYINKCPELEELPSFSSLCCVEKIEIASCGKLQNIMVPTSLIKLSLQSCRDLQRVEGTGDLTELGELYINKCPELEELPSFSGRSMWRIEIHSSEKLENISGFEESDADTLKLCNCSNAVIRNCIRKLKWVNRCVLIGRAVDGAESSSNEYIFSDEADSNTDADSDTGPDLKVLIKCFIVVVDSSTSVEEINKSLGFNVREGEWIITVVDYDISEVSDVDYYISEVSDVDYRSYISVVSDVLRSHGIVRKEFLVWASQSVKGLQTIVDRI